ncbi:hypothetical protein CPT_MarsHill_196 [Staphylococcus phage MarsHill]|nr:hypothetical protein CPT_MarsHill_196 [Staphylococcus phage MarsHill]
MIDADTLKHIIEKEDKILGVRKNKYEFEYKGYKAFIVRHDLGFLNGYIEVGDNYDKDVEYYSHGGITYENNGIIGFDCCHLIDDLSPEIYFNNLMMKDDKATYKSLEYVKETLMKMIDFLAKDDENE